jgi:hypothetical protein
VSVVVDAKPDGVVYYVTDPTCSCMRAFWPGRDACVATDDTFGCACTATCPTSARIVRGSTVLGETANIQDLDRQFGGVGAALGGPDTTLVLDGCGDEVAIPLPETFPDAPVVSMVTAIPAGIHVEWSSRPDTAALVIASAMYGAMACRTEVGATSFDVAFESTDVGVAALAVATTGPGYTVWASSSKHAF